MNFLKCSLAVLSIFAAPFVLAKGAKEAGAASAVSILKFTDAKIILPAKGSTTTAGYVVIENKSAEDVKFKIVEVKSFKAAEMHETYEEQGRMGMRQIEDLTISAKQSFALKPGGHHIMLFDSTSPLKAGQKLDVTYLANDKKHTTSFKVTERSDADASSEHHHHH